MAAASGPGYVHATVTRDCADAGAAAPRRRSAYEGVASDRVGAFDPVFGGYAYCLPFVVTEGPYVGTCLHVQNTDGGNCASVEVWLGDAACRHRLCAITEVAPGKTRTVDVAACTGGEWRGLAWLRSSGPLAVVSDVAGPGGTMSYVGSPANSLFVDRRDDPAVGWPDDGGRDLTGPVAYAGWQGWDTVVAVQNGSADRAAKVRLSAVDASGHVAATLVDWLCPNGGRHFSLGALADLPAGWRGSVRVTSEPWWYTGDGQVYQPAIVGVVLLVRGADPLQSAGPRTPPPTRSCWTPRRRPGFGGARPMECPGVSPSCPPWVSQATPPSAPRSR